MVRRERFELPTAWFVARYSIQLSYRRTRFFDLPHFRFNETPVNKNLCFTNFCFTGGEGGIRTLDEFSPILP